ncbi:MAG: hypothetical protein HY001_05205, partial [Candidatus Portnoybacteria bacterium]|nr:hypothetical protein [Candidatus Portnoybacteria bacterium]
ASSTSDVLSFEGTGGITISFDSINKKIVFSSTNPTLLSVLQQGADASSFTGTTKIAGLTITSSGTITAGTWQGGAVAGSYGGTGLSSFSAGDILYASATTTLSRLGIGSTNTILTSSGSLPQWSSSLALGGTLSAGASVSSTATILTANQTGSGLIVDFQQSGSSRFSVNTAGNLTVAGTLNVTGDITTSGKLRESSGALIPTGAVLPFNLSTCPAGWSALDGTGGRPDARGRYITGLPASGTLAGTNGTALSNLEDRPVGQHNHGITDPTHRHDTNVYTDGGATPPSVPLATSSQNRNGVIFTGYVGTGITINNAGSVAGTNAPYIQFLLCQKD